MTVCCLVSLMYGYFSSKEINTWIWSNLLAEVQFLYLPHMHALTQRCFYIVHCPLTLSHRTPFKRVTQWTLEKAESLLYVLWAACRSLEEFCSLVTDKLQWLAKLQEPWRSGFLCGARIYPLHHLNPSTNLNIYVNTLLTAYLFTKFQRMRALFIAGTGVYFAFRNQHWPMKRTFFVAREIVSGVQYP
jgi:hypothetical protein